MLIKTISGDKAAQIVPYAKTVFLIPANKHHLAIKTGSLPVTNIIDIDFVGEVGIKQRPTRQEKPKKVSGKVRFSIRPM